IFVMPAIRWSALAVGDCERSTVRSNAFTPVVEARKSFGGVNPSGSTRSTYASTLLPTVSVALGASHGSLLLNGLFCSATRLGETKPAVEPAGTPVGCGVDAVPIGPSNGWNGDAVPAKTR